MRNRITACVASLVLAACALLALPRPAWADPEYQTLEQLEGKKVGVGVGTIFDQLIQEKDPQVEDFSYFTTAPDLVVALQSGKVDAFVADEPNARLLVARNTGIEIMPEGIAQDQMGFCLTKNNPLTGRMSEVIDRLRDDGTLEALEDEWCGADESTKALPAMDWDTSAGTMRVALEALYEPISYMRGDEIVGYDVELAMLCAKELRMGIEFQNLPFESVLASVQAGKADVAIGGISVTEERQKTMDFTSPTFIGSTMLVVRSTDGSGAASGSLVDGLKDSFNKTFIVENRWLIILSGLGVTMLITFVSGLRRRDSSCPCCKARP